MGQQGAWCTHLRWMRIAAISAVMVASVADALAASPVAAENVNVVPSRPWPYGDQYMRQQNEPSLAVSSANPANLLGGMNDYRTVDVPIAGLTGDSWVGVIRSTDGGQTWRSDLLPGSPQQCALLPTVSPLCSVNGGTNANYAAADPVVRAGPGGLFYYSAITFDRVTNLGQVFVSRFIDLDNRERLTTQQGEDSFKYLGTRIVDDGSTNRFMDKPWIAVDAPRNPNAPKCRVDLPTGSTPSGPLYIDAFNVYLAYTVLNGSKENSGHIYFTWSKDCGATWETPHQISQSATLNQAASIAVDPLTGDAYVAWRRFYTSSADHAIVMRRWSYAAQDFDQMKYLKVVAPLGNGDGSTIAFDQLTGPDPYAVPPIQEYRFKTRAFPTIAVSVDESSLPQSRVHIAWAQRHVYTGDAQEDGRVVVATSKDGGTSFVISPADPIVEDSAIHGHQFMPALTFTQGRLMLAYYDSRYDQAVSYYDAFYTRIISWPGGTPPSSIAPFIGDAMPTIGAATFVHTIDVRVAQAEPVDSPKFTSTLVSDYRYVFDDTTGRLRQAGFNRANLIMFDGGQKPFVGDYIDVAGQMFVSTKKADGSTGWKFNTARVTAPVHHVVFTTNEDVIPPGDGDWTHYTPIGSSCDPDFVASRNQNVYSSRITEGLRTFSPQNVKPLSPDVERTFIVGAQNTSAAEKVVRLSIHQPLDPAITSACLKRYDAPLDPAGKASCDLNVDTSNPDTTIPPYQTAFWTLVVKANSSAATIGVDVSEQACTTSSSCSFVLAGHLDFNPPGSDVGRTFDEEYITMNAPQTGTPQYLQGDYGLRSYGLRSYGLRSYGLRSYGLRSYGLRSTDLTGDLSQALYLVQNTGTAPSTYEVSVAGQADVAVTLSTMKYYVPAAGGTCVSADDPLLPAASSSVSIPPSQSSGAFGAMAAGNGKISIGLAPGEKAWLVLSAKVGLGKMADIVSRMFPCAGPAGGCISPLLLTGSVPTAYVNIPYDQTLILSGQPPYASSVDSGIVPPGLTVVGGRISGTPTSANTVPYSFTVTVKDSGGLKATQGVTVTVAKRATTTTLTASPTTGVYVGQMVRLSAKVTPTPAPAGAPAPDGNVEFFANGSSIGSGSLTGGIATLDIWPMAGSPTYTAEYAENSGYLKSSSNELTYTVLPATTSVSLAAYLDDGSIANSSVFGQPVTLKATVAYTNGTAGALDGSVTFYDQRASGTVEICSAVIAAAGTVSCQPSPNTSGVASFTTSSLAAGAHVLTATYSGTTPNVAGSSSPPVSFTVGPVGTNVTVTTSPSSTTDYGTTVNIKVTVCPATGSTIPIGQVSVSSGGVNVGSATLTDIGLGCDANYVTFSTATLPVGSDTILATFTSADTSRFANGSGSTVQVVKAVYYGFTGFISPLGKAVSYTPTDGFTGSWTTAKQKLGSVVPIKYKLTGVAPDVTASGPTLKIVAYRIGLNCTGSALPVPTTPQPPQQLLLYANGTVAAGGSTFRYDSSGGQYVFNWDTSKPDQGIYVQAGCYEIVLSLRDNSLKATNVVF